MSDSPLTASYYDELVEPAALPVQISVTPEAGMSAKRSMVGGSRIELLTSSVSTKRSPAELTAHGLVAEAGLEPATPRV
jgi:hypothetical protein